MTESKELEVIILYTLASRGGKVSASRALEIILSSGWLHDQPDDHLHRQTVNETKIANDLRWSRNRLRELGQLDGSQPGTWIISSTGRERLHRIAGNVAKKSTDELHFLSAEHLERYTPTFLMALREYGDKLPESLDAWGKQGDQIADTNKQ
jgi:hypothetical protein